MQSHLQSHLQTQAQDTALPPPRGVRLPFGPLTLLSPVPQLG